MNHFSKLKENAFKKMLKQTVKVKSFQYLIDLHKSKHSQLKYTKFKTQSYLTSRVMEPGKGSREN